MARDVGLQVILEGRIVLPGCKTGVYDSIDTYKNPRGIVGNSRGNVGA